MLSYHPLNQGLDVHIVKFDKQVADGGRFVTFTLVPIDLQNLGLDLT